MRKLFVLAFVLSMAAYAWAGSYTVTTTTAQDAKIGRMRTYANTHRLPGAPWATDQAFVEAQCKQRLGDLFQSFIDAEDDQAFEAAWDAASVATKNSVCSSLGLAAGCKP